MAEKLPVKIIGTVFLLELVCLLTLKWLVDVCLPTIPQSLVFSRFARPPAAICAPIIDWDVAGRAIKVADNKKAQIGQSERLNSDSVLAFPAREFRTLTLTLSVVPKDPDKTIRLLFFAFLLAMLIGGFSNLVASVLARRKMAREASRRIRPRRLTAIYGLMPGFRENRLSANKGKISKEQEKGWDASKFAWDKENWGQDTQNINSDKREE